ncbi:MAG: formylglycine-generating enzyme family protein [Spirochaetes bacterium]|nr:formylglycine-generating enzyme family protein [Spirochaetota bacterium]
MRLKGYSLQASLIILFVFTSILNAKIQEFTGKKYTNSAGMVFHKLPEGSFMMGSENTNGHGSPIHKVSLSSFYIARTETTYAQWQKVYDWAMTNGYASFAQYAGYEDNFEFAYNQSKNCPVMVRSFYDIIQWCNAASEKDGKTPCYSLNGHVYRYRETNEENINCIWDANGYRLPSEAEWEYACRAGATNMYYWGNEMDESYTWWYGNSGDQAHPVASKKPNAWGLFDISGNASEWCWDWYKEYDKNPVTNPRGPKYGIYRVQRGSYFGNTEIHPTNCLRPDYRDPRSPNEPYYGVGFRPAFILTDNRQIEGDGQSNRNMKQSNKKYDNANHARIVGVHGFTNSIGGIFCRIPEGTVNMYEGLSDRKVKTVRVSNYYLADTELTYAHWKIVYNKALRMGYVFSSTGEETGARYRISDDSPVTDITWFDAVKWCNALSELEKKSPCYMNKGEIYKGNTQGIPTCRIELNGYRLPTEAEWEYASRAGSRTQYFWGKSMAGGDLYAWYEKNSDNKIHPVAQKLPNAWMIYDTVGNVMEWCNDWEYAEQFGVHYVISRGIFFCDQIQADGDYIHAMTPLGEATWFTGLRLAATVK